MTGPELRHVRGHIEVFQHGAFLFSADTEEEARRELVQAPPGFPAGLYGGMAQPPRGAAG